MTTSPAWAAYRLTGMHVERPASACLGRAATRRGWAMDEPLRPRHFPDVRRHMARRCATTVPAIGAGAGHGGHRYVWPRRCSSWTLNQTPVRLAYLNGTVVPACAKTAADDVNG